MALLATTDHELVVRDPKWTDVRNKYISTHNKCVVCGATQDLQIHHIFPVSYIRALGRPELELDVRNFMTLCESPNANHHLLIGHLDLWESVNLAVNVDADKYKNLNAASLKQNVHWKAEVKSRPSPANSLTHDEKKIIIQMMDIRFGKKS